MEGGRPGLLSRERMDRRVVDCRATDSIVQGKDGALPSSRNEHGVSWPEALTGKLVQISKERSQCRGSSTAAVHCGV